MSDKERCGCGRTAGEVIRALVQLNLIKPPPPEETGFLATGLRDMRGIVRSQAGMWLDALPQECGLEKTQLDPIYELMKQEDYFQAAVDVLDALRKCAGMTR